MFKKMVKVFSLVLCLVLLCSTFSACKNTNEEDEGSYYWVDSYIETTIENDNNSDTSKDTSGKTTKKTVKKKSTKNINFDSNAVEKATGGRFDVDLSGKTIKLLVWYTPEDYEQKIYDEFEKKTGATVKLVQCGTSSVQQKLTALVAANNAPDATMMDQNDFPSLIIKKLVQPISKYVQKDKDTWLAYDIMDIAKYNNEYYGVTDHFWGGANFIYYNKKIFSNSTKVKKTPLDYFNEGNWNWDTFYDLAEKLTEFDDKGNVTQLGFLNNEFSLFAQSAGASCVSYNNGTFKNTINTPELKAAYNLEKKLNQNKYTSRSGDWKGGKVAMQAYAEYPIRSGAWSWYNYSFQWDWVPFPSYTGGKSYQPTRVQFGVIPSKAKNPEAGYLLLDWRAYCQENMVTTSQQNAEWKERYRKAVTGNTKFSLEYSVMGSKAWTLLQELPDPNKGLQTTIDSWSTVIDGKIRDYEKEREQFNF